VGLAQSHSALDERRHSKLICRGQHCRTVLGVDVDPNALSIAADNISEFEVSPGPPAAVFCKPREDPFPEASAHDRDRTKC